MGSLYPGLPADYQGAQDCLLQALTRNPPLLAILKKKMVLSPFGLPLKSADFSIIACQQTDHCIILIADDRAQSYAVIVFKLFFKGKPRGLYQYKLSYYH